MQKKLFTSLLLVSSLVASSLTPGFNIKVPQQVMTPDKVETRLGTLNFYDGVSTDATIKKMYDNLDFMRGVEVFLNFIPATSIQGMMNGLASMGVEDYNEILITDKLLDSTPLFLTGNTDTVYAVSFFDLKENGPMVIEIPKGAGPGTINDAFFRFVVDTGAPGPDRKKGGTYIILPPNYKGELKPTPNTFADNHSTTAKINGETKKVWIAQSRSYTNWVILRGFLVDGKPNAADKMWRDGLKIYPLAKAANHKKMKFISGSKQDFNTIHANDYEFYVELNEVIQHEPIDLIEPQLRGLAAAIGIVKGQPFAPDARMKKILTESVAVANATARSIMFKPRDKQAYIYPNRFWITPFVGGDYRWLDGTGQAGRNLDARTLFFYQATVNTPAMALQIPGVGSNYGAIYREKSGDILYGSKTYKIHLPKNIPAKDFWSLTAYDPQTRSELQTDNLYPSINNKIAKLDYNKDGSVDVYFGPTAPKGHENNWIQTEPNKAWFLILRLYGPLTPWFDKTWQPGDLELLK
ncbi:DUF1254 domain-containing protein [Sulfurimonas sp. SAG-AH-194-C21]|nr:DUF1254 domain-containing protein [Sulfurimonas sp. SAG-AH-194-C21]MDF1883364.1 DUF1254 domain-containing protein [Sulfurimonas sp. SAG-AH-194-C21]